MKVLTYQRLESTNQLGLKLAAQETADPLVIRAHVQSGGQGQYGRSFHSPAGGLYFSLVHFPGLDNHVLPLLPLAVGVACGETIEEQSGLDIALKWPNDLYCHGRKLGGILVQSVMVADRGMRAVIGIGINANSRLDDFPVSLRDRITTLREVLEGPVDLDGLMYALLHGTRKAITTLGREREKIVARWQTRDYCNGRTVYWYQGENLCRGTGQRLLGDGRYLVRDGSGKEHPLLSGSLLLNPPEEERRNHGFRIPSTG